MDFSIHFRSVSNHQKKRENILDRGKNYFSQRSDRTRTSTTTRWKAETLIRSKMHELASETVEKKYFHPVEYAYLDTVHLRVCENWCKMLKILIQICYDPISWMFCANNIVWWVVISGLSKTKRSPACFRKYCVYQRIRAQQIPLRAQQNPLRIASSACSKWNNSGILHQNLGNGDFE